MGMTISREPSGPELIQFTVRHKSDLTVPQRDRSCGCTPSTPREKDTTVELKFYSALKTNFQGNETPIQQKKSKSMASLPAFGGEPSCGGSECRKSVSLPNSQFFSSSYSGDTHGASQDQQFLIPVLLDYVILCCGNHYLLHAVPNNTLPSAKVPGTFHNI